MEILVAIAAKIAECAVESVVRSVGPTAKIYLQKSLYYSFHYSRNIGSMKNQVEKLQLASDRVQHSVDAARRNGEVIEGDVIKWLIEVDAITEEARKFLDREEETRTKDFNGAFLNLKLRHQLSKKAKKIVKDIGKVLENGSFERASYRPAPQGIVLTGCRDYVAYESTMSTVKSIMEALKDDNIQVIGVWGMAGVGKSTLVREVANLAKEEKLFDEVAMANVTSSPDIRRIQAEIADMLDLKFDKETVLGRASILWERLSQNRKKPVILHLEERLTKTKDHKKKILVILDDIWETLDLEAIGIPYEGCKVLLTSRIRDVFFSKMGTQKEFCLEVLLEEEAWNLFEKMAGDCVKDPILRCIAIEVAKECAGLPLALVTVSKALKKKSLYEWKDALQQLRKPVPEHLTRMQSTIYSSIELSYKHLESKEVRDVFLLCAQMGDHILERDLLELCYGLGLFHGINTMEDARNRLYTILRTLQDYCLLRESHSSSQFLCMHEVVRDAATLIASRDGGDLPLRISHIHGGDHNMHGQDCPLQISNTNSQISEQLNIYGKDQNMYGGDPPLHISHMYGGDHNMYGGDHPLQISSTNSQISKQLKEVVEQSYTNSKISEQLKEVVEQLKEVGATLKAFNKGPIDPDHLYEEVVKMEEYDEVKLASACDYLMYDDKAARAFLAKNTKLRKIWLEEFLNNHED